MIKGERDRDKSSRREHSWSRTAMVQRGNRRALERMSAKCNGVKTSVHEAMRYWTRNETGVCLKVLKKKDERHGREGDRA